MLKRIEQTYGSITRAGDRTLRRSLYAALLLSFHASRTLAAPQSWEQTPHIVVVIGPNSTTVTARIPGSQPLPSASDAGVLHAQSAPNLPAIPHYPPATLDLVEFLAVPDAGAHEAASLVIGPVAARHSQPFAGVDAPLVFGTEELTTLWSTIPPTAPAYDPMIWRLPYVFQVRTPRVDAASPPRVEIPLPLWLNAGVPHDVVIDVFSREPNIRVSGHPTVVLPDRVSVPTVLRNAGSELLFTVLLDHVFGTHPGATVASFIGPPSRDESVMLFAVRVGDSGLAPTVYPYTRQPERVFQRPVIVHGSLNPETIRRLVLRNYRLIQECIPAQGDEDIQSFTATFTIAKAGPPNTIRLTDFVPSTTAATRECIRHVLAGLAFPEPPAGDSVHVTYPFTLRPMPSREAIEQERVKTEQERYRREHRFDAYASIVQARFHVRTPLTPLTLVLAPAEPAAKRPDATVAALVPTDVPHATTEADTAGPGEPPRQVPGRKSGCSCTCPSHTGTSLPFATIMLATVVWSARRRRGPYGYKVSLTP